MEYKISRFTSYGIYGGQIISTSLQETGLLSQADSNGYPPKTLLITPYIDVSAETSRQNDTTPQENIPVENYLGNGEYVTLQESRHGNRIFPGAIPYGSQPIRSCI